MLCRFWRRSSRSKMSIGMFEERFCEDLLHTLGDRRSLPILLCDDGKEECLVGSRLPRQFCSWAAAVSGAVCETC